jgi:hypothetical protein
MGAAAPHCAQNRAPARSAVPQRTHELTEVVATGLPWKDPKGVQYAGRRERPLGVNSVGKRERYDPVRACSW